jgi:tight adherence protein B
VILALMPPIILVFLQLASPDYLSPLYGTPVGILIMTAALAVSAVSFIWSARITNVEI